MQDHWVKIGGIDIPVHVTDATEDTDAIADDGKGAEGPRVQWNQEMFSDADAVGQLHPKIRRLIKAQLKSHSDPTKMKRQAAAQKAAEADRMMKALKTMDKDFDEWLTQMLLDNTRVEVSKMILSQANKKHAKMKKAPRATGVAKKGLHKFIKAFFKRFQDTTQNNVSFFFKSEVKLKKNQA